MHDHFAKQLKHFRIEKGLTQKNIANLLNLTPTAVSDYEAGKREPSFDLLVKLADCYGINIHWLLTGTGPMFLSNIRAREGQPDQKFVTVPVVADIAAGVGIEAEDVEPTEFLSLASDMLPSTGPYYCFRVAGISMEPELHTGDYAIVAAFSFAEDYNGAICAFRSVDGLLIKRLVHDHRRKKALLIPLNPSQKISVYDENSSDVVLIGRLTTVIRNYL